MYEWVSACMCGCGCGCRERKRERERRWKNSILHIKHKYMNYPASAHEVKKGMADSQCCPINPSLMAKHWWGAKAHQIGTKFGNPTRNKSQLNTGSSHSWARKRVTRSKVAITFILPGFATINAMYIYSLGITKLNIINVPQAKRLHIFTQPPYMDMLALLQHQQIHYTVPVKAMCGMYMLILGGTKVIITLLWREQIHWVCMCVCVCVTFLLSCHLGRRLTFTKSGVAPEPAVSNGSCELGTKNIKDTYTSPMIWSLITLTLFSLSLSLSLFPLTHIYTLFLPESTFIHSITLTVCQVGTTWKHPTNMASKGKQ